MAAVTASAQAAGSGTSSMSTAIRALDADGCRLRSSSSEVPWTRASDTMRMTSISVARSSCTRRSASFPAGSTGSTSWYGCPIPSRWLVTHSAQSRSSAVEPITNNRWSRRALPGMDRPSCRSLIVRSPSNLVSPAAVAGRRRRLVPIGGHRRRPPGRTGADHAAQAAPLPTRRRCRAGAQHVGAGSMTGPAGRNRPDTGRRLPPRRPQTARWSWRESNPRPLSVHRPRYDHSRDVARRLPPCRVKWNGWCPFPPPELSPGSEDFPSVSGLSTPSPTASVAGLR
jgi:hypothetical protein